MREVLSPNNLHSERLSPNTLHSERLSPKGSSHTETQSHAPKFPGKSSGSVFLEFLPLSGRNPHVCGNVHGNVEIPQSTRTRTRTRTRASSGGEGRHGERRGGAKRIARGLKTRIRPQMMVMMACVAFRVLKTKNGAAIAVRDGGHDIGRTNPTSWASARASTASGCHRRRGGPSTRPW